MDHEPSPPPRRNLPAATLAACFLLPLKDPSRPGDSHWRRAGRWLPLWGLVIGVLYVGAFSLAWRGFGEYQGIRWLPAVAVLVADLGWLGYRLLDGGVRVVAGEQDGPWAARITLPALVTVILIAAVKFALLASMPLGMGKGSPPTLWNWGDPFFDNLFFYYLRLLFYPRPIYRALILMPFWGRWAMNLALTIGRAAPHTTDRLKTMTAGASLRTCGLWWLAGTVLTLIYCSSGGGHIPRAMVMILGVLLVAYLCSFVLARVFGGQTEATVTATALVSEITFLSLYVGLSSSIYWY